MVLWLTLVDQSVVGAGALRGGGGVVRVCGGRTRDVQPVGQDSRGEQGVNEREFFFVVSGILFFSNAAGRALLCARAHACAWGTEGGEGVRGAREEQLACVCLESNCFLPLFFLIFKCSFCLLYTILKTVHQLIVKTSP